MSAWHVVSITRLGRTQLHDGTRLELVSSGRNRSRVSARNAAESSHTQGPETSKVSSSQLLLS